MIKRVFGRLLAFAMFICMPFALCACDALNTDEGAIEKTLSRELDSIKYHNAHTVEELSDNMDLDMLADFDIDGADLMNAYLEGFDYQINSIEVKDVEAKVQVTLTCKSFSDFEGILTSSVKSSETVDAYESMSQKDFNAYVSRLVYDAVSAAEVKQAEPVTLEYVKKGNTWEPQASASNTIVSAMMSN